MVDAEGKVSIPDRLREKYRLMPGTQVIIAEEDDGLHMQVVDAAYVDSLVGKYCFEGFTMQDVLDMKAEEKMLEEAKYQKIFGIK